MRIFGVAAPYGLPGVEVEEGLGRPLVDPLFKDALGNVIAVTEIEWAQADALPFPVCISSTYLDAAGDLQTVPHVSVAFGNVVLADHGLTFPASQLGTVPRPQLDYPNDPSLDRCKTGEPSPVPVRFRPLIPDSPLTHAVPLSVAPLPGEGIPVTAAPLSLAQGSIALSDQNGFASLTLHATNPSLWPQYFGIVASVNASNAQNFDLKVVYNPPGGAAGIHAQVTVETFTGLSLNKADPNYAPARINAQSNLTLMFPSPTSRLRVLWLDCPPHRQC